MPRGRLLPPDRRPTLLRLVVVLAASLAALAVAEVGVRLAGAVPEVAVLRRGRFQLSDNPRRVYEPVPGSSWDGEDLAFYDYRGATNRLGYRDREHAITAAPGTWRIAVLGDSVAAGWGIDDPGAVFPRLVERNLRQAGIGAEVLNFAVSGYNTVQELETLKEDVLPFAPDLVLLAYCLNDHQPPEPNIVQGLRRTAAAGVAVRPDRADRWLLGSALYRLLRFRWSAEDEAAREEELLAGLDGAAAVTAGGGRGETAAIAVRSAWAELAALGREHHFDVAVVVFPIFRGNLARYPFGSRHRALAELSRHHGFAHLDLLPAYRHCAARLAGVPANGDRLPDAPLSLDRYHPSPAGHRCAAANLTRFLVARAPEESRGAEPR